MRLISQNGRYDYPYEHCAVYRDENKIMCRLIGDEKAKVFAEYGSELRAGSVMEMLAEEYRRHYHSIGKALMNSYEQSFGFIPPKEFQFPEA